ncbi:Hypothetical predicted protein [Paramuricea clavata]|uniref:Uncharacterized protein n=1 Tax=Paramuricea clavata TaxID=317549 RepID=A0A6S7GR30_PARCT|nr:Hypothetical predicted protein [Paramuricea clavata]
MAIADRLQRSFIKPWLEIQPDPPRRQAVEYLLKDSHPPLPSIVQVKTVLKHLNPRKAIGSDNIPAWCLKRYAEELAPVVHDIVVASIIQCKHPISYKHAIISPIPKIRPPTDLDSDFHQVSALQKLSRSYSSNSINPVSRSKQTSTPLRAVTPPCLPLPPYLRTGSTQRTTPQPEFLVVDKMELNAKKTKDMWINFTEAPPHLPLRIGDAIIERVDNFKLFGTWFQKDLKWNKHVEETTRKTAKNLYCLRECRRANLPVEWFSPLNYP